MIRVLYLFPFFIITPNVLAYLRRIFEWFCSSCIGFVARWSHLSSCTRCSNARGKACSIKKGRRHGGWKEILRTDKGGGKGGESDGTRGRNQRGLMEVTRPVESKRNQENENETRVKVGRVEIWKTRGHHGKGSGIMAVKYGGSRQWGCADVTMDQTRATERE